MDYVGWFRCALVGAAAVVSLTVWMLLTSPTLAEVHWMPEGFYTPIMAFEFLRNDVQASQFFAADHQLLAQMQTQVKLDMAFLVCYGTFLSLCAVACYSITRQRFLLLGVGLACAGALCDLFENLHLMQIVAAQQQSQPFSDYVVLTALVNAKFISLSLACLLMSLVLVRFGKLGRIFMVSSLLGSVTAFVSLVYPAYSAEVSLLAITLAWSTLMLIALRSHRYRNVIVVSGASSRCG